MKPPVTITVELSADEAWAFAEYLKRVGITDYRRLALEVTEADRMQRAGMCIARALAELGVAPR